MCVKKITTSRVNYRDFLLLFEMKCATTYVHIVCLENTNTGFTYVNFPIPVVKCFR